MRRLRRRRLRLRHRRLNEGSRDFFPHSCADILLVSAYYTTLYDRGGSLSHNHSAAPRRSTQQALRDERACDAPRVIKYPVPGQATTNRPTDRQAKPDNELLVNRLRVCLARAKLTLAQSPSAIISVVSWGAPRHDNRRPRPKPVMGLCIQLVLLPMQLPLGSRPRRVNRGHGSSRWLFEYARGAADSQRQNCHIDISIVSFHIGEYHNARALLDLMPKHSEASNAG